MSGRYSILEEDEKYLSLRNIKNKILTKEIGNKIQTEDKINLKVLILLKHIIELNKLPITEHTLTY